MNLVRLLPVLLSFGLLAAHFSRAGLLPLAMLCLFVPFFLFIKRPWVARSLQLVLLLGAFEWIRTMFAYIEIRMTMGEDWVRLAIILSFVALMTALSGMVFMSRSLKLRYKLGKTAK